MGDADGVQELGGQRGRLGSDLAFVGVVTRVPVALEEGEDLDRVDSARDDGGGVAVGREEPVAVGEGESGPDLAGLLAVRGGIDGEASLADEGAGLVVDPTRRHQGAVHLEKASGVGHGEAGAVDPRARLVEQSKGFFGGE